MAKITDHGRQLSDYAGLIDREYHGSTTHVPMDRLNRAAQFAPYAALTGYEAIVEEAGRLTDIQVTLDGEAGWFIDQRLERLQAHLRERPQITVTYFEKDASKSGGSYRDYTGAVRRVDTVEKQLVFFDDRGYADGLKVNIKDIIRMESPLFRDLEW